MRKDLPAWVFVEHPDQFNAPRLRGEWFFRSLERDGIRVTRIKAGEAAAFPILHPWTFIYLAVPMADIWSWVEGLIDDRCSLIMDVHFPIMDLENVIATDDTILGIIDAKEQLLVNLALADAVTVSQPDWAADLAEINPNVYYLPDLVLPDWLYDADPETMIDISEAEEKSLEVAVVDFSTKMTQAAKASRLMKIERRRRVHRG